jgi:hypothetical protein
MRPASWSRIIMVMVKDRQVDIVPDHFKCDPSPQHPGLAPFGETCMPRIRHCVECPKCRTRYLIAFSPYSNGSYLVPSVDGCWDEYILYCSCRKGSATSRWKWHEVKSYDVLKVAYHRGYGTPEEVLPIDDESQDAWSFDVAHYLNRWKSLEK